MTWKDKLELGLKEDAPYRKDNLPASQVRGPEIPRGEGRSPEIPMARADRNILPREKGPAAQRRNGKGKALKKVRKHVARRSGR
jgi:hypothetical protein